MEVGLPRENGYVRKKLNISFKKQASITVLRASTYFFTKHLLSQSGLMCFVQKIQDRLIEVLGGFDSGDMASGKGF